LAPIYHALSATTTATSTWTSNSIIVNNNNQSNNSNHSSSPNHPKSSFCIHQDRQERVPMALSMSKKTNADILCLQEIEGITSTTTTDDDDNIVRMTNFLNNTNTNNTHNNNNNNNVNCGLDPLLEQWLSRNEVFSNNEDEEEENKAASNPSVYVQGYDSYVWTPLLSPNQMKKKKKKRDQSTGSDRDVVVGLCVAWRSHRHSLVTWEGFPRGMICQFQPIDHTNTNNNLDEDNHQPYLSLRPPPPTDIIVANLHLPARPSNIVGRLKTITRTMQKLNELLRRRLTPPIPLPPLVSMIVIAGDLNGDQHSIAAQLLQKGYIPHGNIQDRHYRYKFTKAAALQMKHGYNFYNCYDTTTTTTTTTARSTKIPIQSIREAYAPITVSLQGRGPGCMDHIFYTVIDEYGSSSRSSKGNGNIHHHRHGLHKPQQLQQQKLLDVTRSKRRHRRNKGESRQQQQQQRKSYIRPNQPVVGIHSVLATIRGLENDIERQQILSQGLPNVPYGYPSDHLPVGVMFYMGQQQQHPPQQQQLQQQSNNIPALRGTDATTMNTRTTSTSSLSGHGSGGGGSSSRGGVTTTVQRRRKLSRLSIGLRRRHNAILNLVADWWWMGEDGGQLTDLIRDQPLYKNKWLLSLSKKNHNVAANMTKEEEFPLQRKSRAPDLMGVVMMENEIDLLQPSLLFLIVEIAVTAADTSRVRKEKLSKYQDLVDYVISSSSVSSSESSLSSSSSPIGLVSSCHLYALVFHEDGTIPDDTMSDMVHLAKMIWNNRSFVSEKALQDQVDQLCHRIQRTIQ
jgi:hypothetical protein